MDRASAFKTNPPISLSQIWKKLLVFVFLLPAHSVVVLLSYNNTLSSQFLCTEASLDHTIQTCATHTHTTRANTDWHTDRSTITRKSNDISKESLSKRKSWISHREKKKEEKKKETTSNNLLPVHESFGVCFLFTLSVLTAWVVNIVVCSKLWGLDTYTILRWIWFRLPTLQTPKHWVSLSQVDYSLMAPYCFLFF